MEPHSHAVGKTARVRYVLSPSPDFAQLLSPEKEISGVDQFPSDPFFRRHKNGASYSISYRESYDLKCVHWYLDDGHRGTHAIEHAIEHAIGHAIGHAI